MTKQKCLPCNNLPFISLRVWMRSPNWSCLDSKAPGLWRERMWKGCLPNVYPLTPPHSHSLIPSLLSKYWFYSIISGEALFLNSRMHSQIVLANGSNFSFPSMGSENCFAHLSVYRNYLEGLLTVLSLTPRTWFSRSCVWQGGYLESHYLRILCNHLWPLRWKKVSGNCFLTMKREYISLLFEIMCIMLF